jgi:hypothetical protein
MSEKRTRRGVAAGALLTALLVGLAVADVFAFVPSCEEELAKAYPPALKADLTACKDPAAVKVPDTAADLDQFTRRLNGTWKLRSRTEQGITVSTEGRYSRLYFDLDGGREGVRGAALLLDRASDPKPAAGSAVVGFWGLEARRKSASRIVLSLSGEAMGSYAHVRVPKAATHEFFEQDNVFVTTYDPAADKAAWDRIVLMENSLTYVSCKDGVVERYVKVSGQKPVVEGASLKDYWQQLKTGGRSATLGVPPLAIGAAFGR